MWTVILSAAVYFNIITCTFFVQNKKREKVGKREHSPFPLVRRTTQVHLGSCEGNNKARACFFRRVSLSFTRSFKHSLRTTGFFKKRNKTRITKMYTKITNKVKNRKIFENKQRNPNLSWIHFFCTNIRNEYENRVRKTILYILQFENIWKVIF